MTCQYCRSLNSEGDHRCRRCGRRLASTAVAAPARYHGSAVLAPVKHAEAVPAGDERPRRAAQSSLFAEETAPRIIPFDPVQREALLKKREALLPETEEMLQASPAAHKTSPKTTSRKTAAHALSEQSSLDFLPTSPQSARTLKTNVEAVIYCDAPVAGPMHRALAALIDSSMIVLGCGIFLAIFQVFGGTLAWTKANVSIFAAALGVIAMFYGFVWALTGRETAGMNWTSLRIINFNGFPPDGKSRALRLVGCWLSYCSGMIGILWALVDEEGLTWHDHMSKTFPTMRETESSFSRQRG